MQNQHPLLSQVGKVANFGGRFIERRLEKKLDFISDLLKRFETPTLTLDWYMPSRSSDVPFLEQPPPFSSDYFRIALIRSPVPGVLPSRWEYLVALLSGCTQAKLPPRHCIFHCLLELDNKSQHQQLGSRVDFCCWPGLAVRRQALEMPSPRLCFLCSFCCRLKFYPRKHSSCFIGLCRGSIKICTRVEFRCSRTI